MAKIILQALLFLQRHYYNFFGMGRHFLGERLKVYFLSTDNWNLNCLVLCSFKFTQVKFFYGHFFYFSRSLGVFTGIYFAHFYFRGTFFLEKKNIDHEGGGGRRGYDSRIIQYTNLSDLR